MLQALLAGVLRHWRLLAAASWIVCGALYLTLPPSPDQFQHAYLGWRLLEGDIPYRDVIDMNWPGVMALHAVATWLFGNTPWSWRAFDFCLFGACALALADLARQAAGREAGKFALILSPPVYAGASYWLAGQHDMSAAQFLVGALWFHVRGYERRAWIWQAGAGLCIGAAMLNKPTVGVIGLLLPLQALALRQPPLRVLGHTTTAGAAALAALVAALGAVLALGTSWSEIFEATYLYNVESQYVGSQSLAELVSVLLHFHYRWIPMVAIGAVPALLWVGMRANRSMAATALLLLWAAGALSYLIQWRGLTYHLAPSMLAVLGMTAISAALVAGERPFVDGYRWKRGILALLFAIALAGIGVKLVGQYRSLPQALAEGDYGTHFGRFHAGDEVTFAEAHDFARQLRTQAGVDCMLHVGTVTSISYLAAQPMPTRFYYYHVLKNLQPRMRMSNRWTDLWEQELNAADCRIALVSRRVVEDWLSGTDRAAHLLRRHLAAYRQSGAVGAAKGLLVYEKP